MGGSPLFFALSFPDSQGGRSCGVEMIEVDTNGPGSRVQHIAEPLARALQLEIAEVECQGRGGGTIIRVFVRKEGGVGIQDCERLHHSLSRALDVVEPGFRGCRLEVSSPGLDRPLKQRKDYQQAVGQNIRVKLHQPVDGNWVLTGRLAEVNDQGVTLQVGGRSSRTRARIREDVALPWEAIVQTKRDIDW